MTVVKGIGSLNLKRVFVAGPFIHLVDPKTGLMPPHEKALIESLLTHFEDVGAQVFNAHRREKWGADFMKPEAFTKMDYEQIASSDLFVVMPGSPPSIGTHIEIGWATALKLPIVMLLDPAGSYSGMIEGMGAIANLVKVKLENKVVDFEALDRAVHEVMARR